MHTILPQHICLVEALLPHGWQLGETNAALVARVRLRTAVVVALVLGKAEVDRLDVDRSLVRLAVRLAEPYTEAPFLRAVAYHETFLVVQISATDQALRNHTASDDDHGGPGRS